MKCSPRFRSVSRQFHPCLSALLATALLQSCAAAQPATAPDEPAATQPAATVRVAAFNTALSRNKPGQLLAAIAKGDDKKVRGVAEVLQRVRPDVVLLSEVDHDATGKLVRAFHENFLSVPQNGAQPIAYPFFYTPEVNTGQPTGIDLDRDGKTDGPGDAHGYGNYPGHYGMLLLSRFPLDEKNIRTFRLLQWKDLPENVMPADWYSPDAAAALRLSSKTHADVPVQLPDGRTVHLLISHPTPPVFDGPEDRNGRRNHDEVRLWADYLDGEKIQDDAGDETPLDAAAAAVILGDLNADPHDGDRFQNTIRDLVQHRRLQQDLTPASDGAVESAAKQGGINTRHAGDPAHDTADFPDFPPNGPGNLRADYALPTANLRVKDAGVFWPTPDDPHAALANVSDHHLVWIDLILKTP